MAKLAVVILAAGQGARMLSQKPKLLHEVGGKPMVQHVFEAAAAVADLKPVLVVAPGDLGVRQLLGQAADYAIQPEPLGTGQATQVAAPLLEGRADQVLVTYGDMPLLRPESLRRLAARQAETGAPLALLTAPGEAESAFGRIVRDEKGRVVAIVEVAAARQRPDGAAILAIRELNVGVYCFAAEWLWEALPRLPLRQARSGPEYYLTDTVELAIGRGQPVEAILTDDADEGLGAGTRPEMAAVEKALRRRTNRRWLAAGVTLVDPEQTYIDPDVAIGRDTVIWPNSFLQGRSQVGEGCVVGPNAVLRDSRLGDRCRVEQAVLEGVTIEDDQRIGPFVHLRGDGRPRRDEA